MLGVNQNLNEPSRRSSSPSEHACTSLVCLQDFLGQAFCTLGEIVGSLGCRLEKPLMQVFTPTHTHTHTIEQTLN